jgi:DNA-binding SARP family transcriptional activator/tetratricopeptide (TPR) repeat protein
MTKGTSGEIRLFCIGDARIETSSTSIDPSASVVFATALYLVLENAKPISRQSLAELLWPNSSKEARTHRLRQTLLRLRRAGLNVESKGKSLIRLANSSIVFEDAQPPALAHFEQGHRSSIQPFSNFDPRLSDEYAEWLDRKRAQMISRIAPSILKQIGEQRAAGQWSVVENLAESLLQIAPLNEEATLALAEALVMRGSKHQAAAILEGYLKETGSGPLELKVQATLMRRRIADAASTTSIVAESPLVGRATTMTKLVELLKKTKLGAGSAFLLKGEAGIGKTRLIAELSRFASLQGFATIRINCRTSFQHRPLSAFVELVPLLRALPGAIGCSPENLQFLDRLTRHQPNRQATSNETEDPAWIFGSIQRALIDLVDAVAEESPLLIQLEDVHWLDSESTDLLREMIDRLPQHVLFGLTARTVDGDWITGDPLRVYQLDPIEKEHAIALVLNIVRQQDKEMPPVFLQWCTKVAEGNPYFLTELATHWVETGAEHDVPASLSTVLKNRLARLDRESLQLLQTCALLENNSTLARIEAVLEYDAFQLLQSIDALGSSGMIVVDQHDLPNGERIVSKHELLSTAALALLSPPAKRFLHRRIGQVLEHEIDERFSAATLWDCAKHWQLAGDNQRAFDLGRSCADYLLKVGLPVQAADAYGKSIEFCTTDAQRLDTLRLQTTAYYRMSAWRNVIETSASIRQLQQIVDPSASGHDDIELMELRAQWQTFDWYGVYQRALRCLAATNATSSHRAEAGVTALMLADYQCDREASQSIFGLIEELIAAGGVSELIALQARMVFHSDYGDIGQAVAVARKLVQEVSSRSDIGELFRAKCNAGSVCRVAGLFDEGQKLFMQALEIATTHGLSLAEQRAILPFAHMALEIGKVEDARRLYARLLEIPIGSCDQFTYVQQQALGVRLAIYDGKPNEAAQLLPFSLDEISTEPVYNKRTYNLALFVAVELSGKGCASREAILKLEESFAKSKTSPHQAFSAFVLCSALWRSGQRKKARKLLRDYETKYRREPWAVPRHLLEGIDRDLLTATDADPQFGYSFAENAVEKAPL